jgi:ubiquinone/menaquinone biosynthesis C-methylase UbiE
MPSHDFGRVADIYDATRSLPEGDMRLVLEALSTAIPSKSPLVDVGVGTGRFARPLQERGYDVVGLDVSKGMMAKAKEKGVINLVFADVHEIPFRDEVFEAALLVHILHLVSDWVNVVKESARVSRGVVISVIEVSDGSGRDVMRDAYRDMRLKMGYPLDRFESGEGGLRDRVSPDSVVPVVESERESPADNEIGHLEARGQSLTWDVPEEAHKKIIAELTARYGGTTLRSKSKIELAIWSAARLRQAFLSKDQKG